MFSSTASGVVELVELDISDVNELILPHVLELEEDEGGRPVGANGFDLDLDLVGEDRVEVIRVCEGVLGAVLVGEGGLAVPLVGDEGGWTGGKNSCLYSVFRELAGVVSSIK